MQTRTPAMKTVWLDYLLSFVFSSFGRIARDWYFANRDGKELPSHRLLSAALYSGVTGLAIAMLLMWWQPALHGSTLIIALSLLAGIGAVDIADVVYTAFRQWARKAAGLDDQTEDDSNGR